MHDQQYWKGQKEVVISGVSGRFPLSSNINEFAENLFNGVDLVTENDLRWPPGIYDLPKRHGKLKELHKFDASFFGITPKQANNMDPQVRKLLEVSWEAILDSGCNPANLRGTRTGVFVGCSGSETGSALSRDPEKIIGYSLIGTVSCMFSNWISYAFDLCGPSFSVDSACSSSLLALNLALDSIRQGHCDAAIVAGSNLHMSPMTSLQFWRLGMLSPEGSCRSFDDSADGYCRTEGIAAIFIQKKASAKRIYFTIVHAKSDTDGYKEEGIAFPSGERQAKLLREVYSEAGIDPNEVFYVETHGTGTKVGDPQEAYAISEVFCTNRKTPLLIGSVKSNMGHAEPAAGVCALSKLIIAREHGFIPPNLHYKTPNTNIPSLFDGRLKVVTEKTPFNGKYVGVNSFGFGGSKTHVILKIEDQERVKKLTDFKEIQLFLYAERNLDALKTIFKLVQEDPHNHYFNQLLSNQSNLSTKDAPYRGMLILNRQNNQPPLIDIQKCPSSEKRPIWFVYTGIGSQWNGMGQQLFKIPQFEESVQKSSKILEEYNLNVYEMLQTPDPTQYQNNPTNCMVAIAAIQIALTDILSMLGVIPDGIIGHSFGETCCAYADGALTREQAMKAAYVRGSTIMSQKYPVEGSMAAVGLTWEAAKTKCIDGVFPACHNGEESVTVSGEVQRVYNFCNQLQSEGIFTQLVDSSGIPFHSPFLNPVKEPMLKNMTEIIPYPKRRSSKWISASLPEEKWDEEIGKYCSPEYIVNNVCNEVLFYEALQHIPSNSIIVEVSPHCLMQAILRRNVPSDCSNIGLMNKHAENELESFLKAIGKIYQSGGEVHIEKLYEEFPFPVPPGTPMIAPLWQWNHSQDWFVANSKNLLADNCWASYDIDPFSYDTTEGYLLDHVIGGRLLYPFTGFIVLAWRAFCKLKGLNYLKTPVVLEDFTVHRAVLLSKTTHLTVVTMPGSGDFEIIEDGQLVADGKIFVMENNLQMGTNASDKKDDFIQVSMNDVEPISIVLTAHDIYKEFQLRGYDFGPSFKCINNYSFEEKGTIHWKNNWVTFLDAIIQTILIYDKRSLWNLDTIKLPTKVRRLEINPLLNENFIETKDDKQLIEFEVLNRNCQKMKNFMFKQANVKAGGVKLYGFQFQSVNRRTKTKGKLQIEKLEFIKNFNSRVFDNEIKKRDDLNEYITCLKEAIGFGLKEWHKNGLFQNLKNGNLFAKMFNDTMIFGSKNGIKMAQLKKFETYLNDDRYQLAHFVNAVLIKLFQNENIIENDFHEKLGDVIEECTSKIDMDILWAAELLNERLFKVAQDICIENSLGYNIRFAAIDVPSTEVLRHYVSKTERQILFNFNFSCVGEMVDHLDDTILNMKVQKFCLSLDNNEFKNTRETRNFDALFINKVLHRKSDPVKYLLRCKELLRDAGLVVISEITQHYEIPLVLHAFQNIDTINFDTNRIYGLYFTSEQLEEIFDKAGYWICFKQTDPSVLTTTYVLKKIPRLSRIKTFVEVNDVKTFDWIKPLQQTIIENLNEPEHKTIWLTDTVVKSNGMIGLVCSLRREYMKRNRFRVLSDISVKKENRNGQIAIDLNDEKVKKLIHYDMATNYYRDGQWGSIKDIEIKEEERIAYKECDHAFVDTLTSGDISSLAWIESPNQYFDKTLSENRDKQLCYVYYSALNFRDIMVAYGQLPVNLLPENQMNSTCLLGMEFSGRLTNGNRVMGILSSQALATTAVVDEKFLWKVPDNWTLAEAATVPVAYLTAYYALIIRGNLQKGEKVLIHSGSGGVGQAAISICLDYGCEIFTTVSSDEKREFLMQRFPQLNVKNFANSRDTSFEQTVLEQTEYFGVDIVLNSLASEKLQASIRCLGMNGRFLEIGKFDMVKNSSIGMQNMLKNITFHGVLLDSIFNLEAENIYTMEKLHGLLIEGIQNGMVHPLNQTIFEKEKVEDAFRYMSQGKHMGKILIEIRKEEAQKIFMPVPLKILSVCRNFANSNHVYLITGGLGGFGLELAQWLISRGAKKLVLTSRKGITNGYQKRCVDAWTTMNAQVEISTFNIASEKETLDLIEFCQTLGPIGGIFHLPMVLRDTVFENQTVENFQISAEPKYYGTINLDMATRKLCDENLKWFVAFSSASAKAGNAGQTNYSWSNSAMERVIEQRREDGLPGMAIQWGPIGDVGTVIENYGNNDTILFDALPQRIVSCFKMLDLFLSWNYPIVSSYIRADTIRGENEKGNNILKAIAHIIGVNDIKQLNMDANLGDLGLDSLMGVEVKQTLERDFNVILSMKDLRNLTLNKLQKLVEEGQDEEKSSNDSENPLNDNDENQSSLENLNTKQQIMHMFKLCFDFQDLEAKEPLVKCNKVEDGPIVFFVHPIEGVWTPLRSLINKCKFQAYCFQFAPGVPHESAESVAEYYIQEMKKIQPIGPYNIIAYSYGTCIGFEMAIQLQRLDGNQSVKNLIMIDSSHLVIRTYRDMYHKVYELHENTDYYHTPIVESELLCAVAIRCANVNYKKFRNELVHLVDFHERVQKVVDAIMEMGFIRDPKSIEYVCEALRAKYAIADKYIPERKFHGTITLIRSTKSLPYLNIDETLGQDYGLSSAADSVKLHIIDGDHNTIVQEQNSTETAQLIHDTIF